MAEISPVGMSPHFKYRWLLNSVVSFVSSLARVCLDRFIVYWQEENREFDISVVMCLGIPSNFLINTTLVPSSRNFLAFPILRWK